MSVVTEQIESFKVALESITPTIFTKAKFHYITIDDSRADSFFSGHFMRKFLHQLQPSLPDNITENNSSVDYRLIPLEFHFFYPTKMKNDYLNLILDEDDTKIIRIFKKTSLWVNGCNGVFVLSSQRVPQYSGHSHQELVYTLQLNVQETI